MTDKKNLANPGTNRRERNLPKFSLQPFAWPSECVIPFIRVCVFGRPLLKHEFPTLKYSQLKEKLWDMWQKESPARSD